MMPLKSTGNVIAIIITTNNECHASMLLISPLCEAKMVVAKAKENEDAKKFAKFDRVHNVMY